MAVLQTPLLVITLTSLLFQGGLSQATECERERGQHCHKWAQCERRQGDPKPRCYCSPGYQGDGQNCNRDQQIHSQCCSPNNIHQGSFSPKSGSYNVGMVISYRCNNGFTLRGNGQRTCESDGNWSGAEPRCDKPDECQKRNHQTCHSQAECVRLSDKKYKCKCRDDYKGDGMYCERKGCQRPPGISNGKLLTNQQNFVRGNIVSYKCDRGYELIGHAQRSCQNNGEWSGEQPRCEQLPQMPVKKSCPHPEGIRNGEVRFSDGSYRPGSKVTYSCRKPYKLAGNSQRTCQDDGTWNGAKPRCQRARRHSRSCQRPQDIPHGYFTTSDSSYKPKTVITYQCRQPYRLVGSNQRRCLANGQWNGPIPRCQDTDNKAKKRCQQPPNGIAHGNIKISNYELVVGTVVTFTCNKGWRLQGDSQRTCQDNRSWSGNQPECRQR